MTRKLRSDIQVGMPYVMLAYNGTCDHCGAPIHRENEVGTVKGITQHAIYVHFPDWNYECANCGIKIDGTFLRLWVVQLPDSEFEPEEKTKDDNPG